MLSGHFKCLVAREQQARKDITLLAKIINPDNHGEKKLMFYGGGKKNTFDFQVFLEDISLYTTGQL